MSYISKIPAFIFAIGWLFFVVADYWQKHPYYYYAFERFSYPGTVLLLLLLGAGIVWWVKKLKKRKKLPVFINGLAVFGLFLLIIVITVGASYDYARPNASFNAVKAINVLSYVTGTALAVYILVLSGYVLGRFILEKTDVKIERDDDLPVAIACGFMGISILLFLLGVIGALYNFVLYPLFLILLFFRRTDAMRFLKTTLWQPIPLDKKLNLAGTVSYYLLLVMAAINFTYIQAPMPPGFDSLTLYANLANLISQHHALVPGYQPYNWSLLMSLGYILFNSTPITLAISQLGGLLSLYAMYVLGRNWLKLDVNHALMAPLAFAITPVFTMQSFGELKIDLGLLFTYLSILLLLLNYFKSETPENTRNITWWQQHKGIALIGLLSGFSLGIKLTTIYFALALLCALWYRSMRERGFLAAFCLALFFILLAKLDDVGGLRQYHLGADVLKWGLLAASVLLMIRLFLEKRKAMVEGLRMSVVFGIFMMLPFFPWMLKNYSETRSLSPDKLLSGKAATPDVSLQKMEQNARLPAGTGQ